MDPTTRGSGSSRGLCSAQSVTSMRVAQVLPLLGMRRLMGCLTDMRRWDPERCSCTYDTSRIPDIGRMGRFRRTVKCRAPSNT